MAITKKPLETDGLLGGLGVLRFAHAFESGGGTERYLDDLDQTLLRRNAMTIVRLHLTRKTETATPLVEVIGKGKLVHIPLPIRPGNNATHGPENEYSFGTRLKQQCRDKLLYNPLIWHSIGASLVANRALPPKPGQAIGAGRAAANAFHSYHIDLAMLHFFGGADADEVIAETQKAGLPFALLNHYSNDRFLHLAIRKHAAIADSLAGVNGLDLPSYIDRRRFTNLSDGIDTDFFNRANARPLENAPREPVILLPARVVREKGQLDLIRAGASLRASGTDCAIAFAGRFDSSEFLDELQREIAKAGMGKHVHFLGALDLEALRDWYAASAVAALPTYHHEGLPRVILEALAMNLPVVAYATGGVADGILPGKTGHLLRTGDISGLADRLRELLASPDKRTAMGAAGRTEAEKRFSLSALATRHEQFYQRVIGDFKADRLGSHQT